MTKPVSRIRIVLPASGLSFPKWINRIRPPHFAVDIDVKKPNQVTVWLTDGNECLEWLAELLERADFANAHVTVSR